MMARRAPRIAEASFSSSRGTLYVPALHPIFRTTPLTLRELFLTLALASLVFFAVDTEKWLHRRARVLLAETA